MYTKIILSTAIIAASLVSLHQAAQAHDKLVVAQKHHTKVVMLRANVRQSFSRSIRGSRVRSGRRTLATKGKESLNGVQLRGTIPSGTISIAVSQIDSIVLPDGIALSVK